MNRFFMTGMGLALATGTAFAQDPPQDWVKPEDAAKALAADASGSIPEGWTKKAKIGASTSYTHNDTVVGLDDGSYFQLGLIFDGEVSLHTPKHAWENTLSIKHQQSKTPTVDDFIKSADELAFQSVYRYYFDTVKWVGPFARFRLNTQLFDSFVVKGADTEILRLDAQGNPEADPIDSVLAPGTGTFHDALTAQERYKLNSSLEPLILRQSAGAFVQPAPTKKVKSSFTLGAGAQEVFTDGGYVVADDPDTDVLEVKALQTYQEVGAEFDAQASGDIDEHLGWNAKLNILYPFVTTADTDLEGAELINTEFSAKLSARLNKYFSVDYVFNAKKVPLVLDEWQIQNNLLLNAAFSVL